MKQNQDGKLKKGKLNIVLMEYLVILGCLITLFVMLVPKERITNNANSYAKPEEVTKYLLTDGYMTRIRPLTEYSTFKEIAENTINSDSQSDKYVVKVYADKEKNKEIKDGYITSGMTIECSLLETELESNEQSGNNNEIASELDVESEEKKVTDYIANVIGDISQDGDCNITELTQMIMHIIGMERLNDQGKELSADFNGDGQINVIDVSMCINYIVYGTMESDKESPKNPGIRIIGEGNEPAGWYKNDINVEIEDNERQEGEISKTQTTVDIKLEGQDRINTQTTTEKQFRLSKNGEYKISSQNYGSNGTRSEIITKTVYIDKTAPEITSIRKETIDANSSRINIIATDNIGIVKYRVIRNDQEENVKEIELNSQINESIIVNQDGQYKIIVEDIAGNTAEKEIKVSGLNKEFSIRFLDDEGLVISRQIYKQGETLEIPNDPLKPDDEMFTYIFKGWNPEVQEIAQEDIDYIAVYEKTPKQYKIRFLDEDGILVGERTFNFTDKWVEEPTPPEKEGYVGVWPEYELRPENMEVMVEYLEKKENNVSYDVTDANNITWRYIYQDGKATQLRYISGDIGQEVSIPKKLDGYQVESLGYQGRLFENAGSSIYRNIEKINIPYGVKIINNSAFSDCNQLTEIEIPDSVETIEGYAFAWNYNLKDINWSENLKRIGEYAFYDCDSLEKLELPEGVEYIGNGAFSNNNNLKSVKLSNNLKTIKSSMFDYCEKLDTIEIPQSIETIEFNAFYCCESLKEINISKNVSNISGGAFRECHNLEKIEVDEENNSYTSVDGILFSKDMQTIVRYPEGKKDISEYCIPEGITEIGENAFYNNDSIVGISIPEGVDTINTGAFTECNNLENVIIPESVTRIENEVFQNCKKLLNVNIPNSVTSIGSGAFYNSGLEAIELPSGITEIKNNTFQECSNLQNVKIKGNVTNIRSSAFSNCRSLTDIYIENTEENVNFANSWNMYAHIHYNDCKHRIDFELDSDTINIQDVSGNLEDGKIRCGKTYQFKLVNSEGEILKDKQIILRSQGKFTNTENYMQMISPDSEGNYYIENVNRNIVVNVNYEISDGDRLVAQDEYGINWNYTYRNGNAEDIYYHSGEISETLNIPSQLNGYSVITLNSIANGQRTILGKYPWDNGSEDYIIKYINIPECITEIKNCAFCRFKALKNITIPNSISILGNSVFEDCEALEEVNIGSGLQEIGISSFNKCNSLKTIFIPGNVKRIGYNAFYRCNNLAEINIGDGVEVIGGYVFQSCPLLKLVNIPNSVNEIGTGAFSSENITDIYVDNYEQDVGFQDGWNPYGYTHYKDCKHDIKFEKYTNIYTTVEEISDNVQDEKIDCYETYKFRLLNNKGKVITSERVLATFTGKPVDTEEYDRIRRTLDNASYLFTNDEEGTIELEPDENGIYTIENIHRNVTVIVGSYRATDENNITWNYSYENGQATNVYYESGEIKRNTINIPVELNGYPVKSLYNKEEAKSIFERAENKDDIKIVNIPEEVDTISNYAFYKMKNVESIQIPQLTTKIGYAAFYSCENLKNINISDSITDIGKWSFAGCSKLDNVVIPENVTKIGEAAFSGCSKLENITLLANIETIEKHLFRECTKLQSLQIPEGVTKIDINAFSYCETLQQIQLPETLTVIGKYAFCNCANMKEISLPNGVKTIEGGAFSDCYNLKSIEIPSTIREIGTVFTGCRNLEDINIDTIESNITFTSGSIYDYGCNASIHYSDCKHKLETKIYADDIRSVAITDNVENEKINCKDTYKFKLVDNEDNILNNCIVVARIKGINGVENRVIHPDEEGIYTLERIMRDTIIGVGERYKTATDDNGITWEYSYINGEATDVHYKSSEREIEETLNIPDSLDGHPVTSLYNSRNESVRDNNKEYEGYNILLETYRSQTVKTINIPESVTEIGERAFSKFYNVENINIPNSVISIGDYAFSECTTITNIEVPDTVTNIGKGAFSKCDNLSSINIPSGVIDIQENTYRSIREIVSVEIPTGVITIGDKAFAYCDKLQRVDMPDSIVIIGNKAFLNCPKLSEIELSNNLKSIGNEAFCNCYALTSIEIPGSVEKIGNSAFNSCINLESVIINEGLKSIGEHAFSGCEKLRDFAMPKSVEYIGHCAFEGCTSLDKIVIWNNISEMGRRVFSRWIETQKVNIEADSELSTWDKEWKEGCEAEIIYGYKDEE